MHALRMDSYEKAYAKRASSEPHVEASKQVAEPTNDHGNLQCPSTTLTRSPECTSRSLLNAMKHRQPMMLWAKVLAFLGVIVGASAAIQICGGGNRHFCALVDGGSVGSAIRCWGRNDWGQLGRGDNADSVGRFANTSGAFLKDVNLGSNLPPVKEIACGGDTTCALFTDGRVKCWGANDNGQLGQERSKPAVGNVTTDMGDNLPFTNLGTGVRAVQVAVGYNFVCVLTDEGRVKCWGSNGAGQLGHEKNYTAWGNTTDTMGNKLPYVPFQSGVNITQLAAGSFHMCAVNISGHVFCWGYNGYGQLGFNDARADYYNLKNVKTRTRYGNQTGDFAALGPVLLSTAGTEAYSALQVAAGHYHSCALLRGNPTNTVKCWGYNIYGQLGFRTPGEEWGLTPNQLAATPAVDLGVTSNNEPLQPVKVIAGGRSTCVILATGALKCWGYNDQGTLGIGDPGEDDKQIIGDADGEVAQTNLIRFGANLIANSLAITTTDASRFRSYESDFANAYYDSFCVVTQINYLKCWGRNAKTGLLLRGPTADENTIIGGNPSEMGDALPFAKLFATFPPQPPSPSPPAPPPSPPSPRPPMPFLDPAQKNVTLPPLPTTLTSALPSIKVLAVDKVQSDADLEETDQSWEAPTEKELKDDPLLIAATVLGSILGFVLVVGLICAICYSVFHKTEEEQYEDKQNQLYRARQNRGLTADPDDVEETVGDRDTAKGAAGVSLPSPGPGAAADMGSKGAHSKPLPLWSRAANVASSVAPALVVSTINPKLSVFQRAAPYLATTIAMFTGTAIIVVLLVMRQQCNNVCATTPLYQIDPARTDLQCVALESNDTLPVYDGVTAGGSLRSSSILAKCSSLHLEKCAQSEWWEMQKCMRDFKDAVAAMPASFTNWETAASTVLAVNTSLAERCTIVTALARGGACGEFAGADDVCWVLAAATNNADLDTKTCKDSPGKARCSQVTYRMTVFQSRAADPGVMCSPGATLQQTDLNSAFDITDVGLCGGDQYAADDGVRCLAVHHDLCQEVDGGGAGFCLKFDSSDSSESAAEPGLRFGPTVLAQLGQVTGFSRDAASHTCAPWPIPALHRSAPVVSGLLFTLASRMEATLATRYKNFLQGRTLNVRVASNTADQMMWQDEAWPTQHPLKLGGGPLGSYFTNQQLYCCQEICPSWLDAIGSAMGLAVYMEMAFMFAVVVSYLAVNKQQARNLNMSLHEIVASVVVNKDDGQQLPVGSTRSSDVKLSTRYSSPFEHSKMSSRNSAPPLISPRPGSGQHYNYGHAGTTPSEETPDRATPKATVTPLVIKNGTDVYPSPAQDSPSTIAEEQEKGVGEV